TTKKGKGAGKISYDFQLTSQSLGKIPHMMNSEQYIDYWNGTGTLDLDNVYRYWDTKTNTSWLDVGFENSLMTRHNLTFQAGSDKGSIYASVGYVNNNGMVRGNADVYERLTGMINATWKIKPWLEITTNNQIEVYNVKSVSSGSEYGSMILGALQMDPLTPAYYTEEELPDFMVNVKNNLGRYGRLLQNEDGLYYGLSPFQNNGNTVHPLFTRDASQNKNTGHNINGSTALNFTPIKGLVFTSRLGYRFSSGDTRNVQYRSYGSYQQNTRYMTVSASDSNSRYWQWENFLNYSRSFGQHNGSIMLGTSFSENRTHSVSGSVHGGVDQNDNVDLGFKQEDPLFYYFAYKTGAAVPSVSGGEDNYFRKLSYFGRLNWDYAGRYMAQVSLRADAADLSVLPKKKRWGYFPAVSIGWVISQEKFMEKTQNWLSHLKFRASWGQNGSTASLGGYLYASEITSQGNVATGNGLEYKPAYQPSATGNYDLKWETSEQTNLGIDARFLNNR
ncbi:MAG: TonB-dependent receptor, partial [Bacteroidaceae bacterium]|nr:TonB-dependent receptor [Bacteroidaceae bacterium]